MKTKIPGIKLPLYYKNERYGTGHAISLTKDIIGNDEVLIVLGDTIAEYDVKDIIASPYSMLGVKKVDDPATLA